MKPKHGKRTKRGWLRLVSGVVLVCLLSVGLFGYVGDRSPVSAATSEELEELQKKAKELDDKIASLNKELNSKKQSIKNEEQKIAQLNDQITNVGQQIAYYNTKIDTVNEAIEIKELEIEEKQSDISVNEELFARQLRAMYISNTSASTISTLLESKSFADFLNRTEYLRRISESNNQLITMLKTQKAELDSLKGDLESQKAELTQTKNDLSDKNKTLDGLLQNSEVSKSQKLQEQKELLAMIEKNKKEQQQLDAEINRLLAELEGNDVYGDGTFIWPLPGRTGLSSQFGWRTLFGKADFHTGLDIPAPAGTAIKVSASGQVVKAGWSNSYGNHVVVDHGGGIATVYAHASKLYVSAGQQVTQGDVIAAVGTTGNSTGNHLHFEMRVTQNGVTKQIDPRTYVTPR